MAMPSVIIEPWELHCIIDLLSDYAQDTDDKIGELTAALKIMESITPDDGPRREGYDALHSERASAMTKLKLVNQQLFNLTFGEKGARI